jgi:coniferyl-aldehyde dehydrogenase
MNAPVPAATDAATLAATAASRATAATGQSDPAGARLAGLFALQKAAFAAEPSPALAVRRDRVARVLDLVTRHQDALVAAVDRDFGHRSAHETRLAELHIVASEARLALRMLPRWMRSRRVRTPLELLPGHGEIRRQPCGVIGIVSPWNYPVQLALAPAIGALAAGNRVLVKPSEITPATSALLAELIAARFREDEFAVVQGDADTGRRFVAQRWDHLFFTGSTAVGRHVAQTAAANLVPVTLELGGKSPALVAADADLALIAPRLVAGKLLNAGQTCIAPDYALVPAPLRDAFVAAVRAGVARLYPTIAANPDYTSIVSDRHYARLNALIDDARAKGATIISLLPAGESPDPGARRLPPTLIVDARDDMAVMQEEIFGPLLPIETYATIDEAIARINARPRPLAFYFFGNDVPTREHVLGATHAGGVTINDTLWHFAHEGLPFGGIGDSGIGAYHGELSFIAFSHEKAVFHQSRLAAGKLLWPPYGATFDRVLALLRRLDG